MTNGPVPNGDHLRELTAKEDLEWLGGFDDL